MILYLVRHGIAVDVGENGVIRDRDRMLSNEGMVRTRAAAEGFAALGCDVSRIISSPLRRARETADLFQCTLGSKPQVETSERLSGDTEVEETMAWLWKQPVKPTMLVGHMPHLAELASSLLADSGQPMDILFKKAAICCLWCDGKALPAGARLNWLLQPRALRAMAGQEQRRC
jgi:phosphohistidine phosphatase